MDITISLASFVLREMKAFLIDSLALAISANRTYLKAVHTSRGAVSLSQFIIYRAGKMNSIFINRVQIVGSTL